MDLQYVINEIATVKYVCSYMMKGEKGMGETLRRVAKECQNDSVHTQMHKIKKEFLGKRVLGAPESTMRVLSMWLMKKSRKVVPVMTSMKDEHVSLRRDRLKQDHSRQQRNNVYEKKLADKCKFCGMGHPQCFAYGKKCSGCRKMNHFKETYRSTQR